MTDEQKQKMANAWLCGDQCEVMDTFSAHERSYLAGLESGLNARDSEVKVLREALEFYADNATYIHKPGSHSQTYIEFDRGLNARRALEHTSKKEVKT